MRGDRSVPSDGEDRHDEDAPKGGEPGEEPTEVVASGGEDGVYANYANVLPSALACFEDDFETCIAHLRLPVTHRCFARTTNLLERLFVEERRRLKIIPNGFGEKPVLKLMFGALIRPPLHRIRAPSDRRRQKRTVSAVLTAPSSTTCELADSDL